MKGAPRIINVSNRLPIKISSAQEEIRYKMSEGGLATGLSSIFKTYENLWIGWPGAVVEAGSQQTVINDLQQQRLLPVFLSKEEINNYYEGFCNEVVWPLFHYFPSYTEFNPQYFEAYKSVNQKFADEILKVATKDDIIWVHDYQLMLVPELVRKAIPGVTIGFFLHIPFPAYPIFMALPWRAEILKGLMGANVIGFQTQDDVRHFTEAAGRVLGLDFVGNEAAVDDRTVVAQAFPISIDYKKYSELAHNDSIQCSEESIRSLLNGNKLAISVDRLDYSKGIIQRLQAYDAFLQQYPEWREKITLLHLVVPSRDTVRNYKELKEEMDRLVNDINGKYATINWQPIKHFYRSVSPQLLAAMYKLADVALVTPLRDGMNLVCKEFVASNVARNGVLILSETAGAARELTDALIVNPNDIDQYTSRIYQALMMPAKEKTRRMSRMQQIVAAADVFEWAARFMEVMEEVKSRKYASTARYIDSGLKQKIEMKYSFATKKLILLDYDGTLVPFHNKPEAAKPDEHLLQIMRSLTEDISNKVVIISGRDHNTLDQWLGHLSVDLIAEHGAWFKESGNSWSSRKDIETSWKPEFYNVLNAFTRATPGSLIEEKTYSIAWHYRQCDPELGNMRAKEVTQALEKKVTETGLQLLLGDKVIEVKNLGINKGKAASKWMAKDKYDFVLAIGDDTTDEDMFKALPTGAVTIKVGSNVTAASYFVNNYKEVRSLLEEVSESAAHFNQSIHLLLAG
jgi:trehalose 6-phosphate synthase/phosphatase